MHALSELQEVTNRYGILAQMLAEEASPWEQEFLQAQSAFAAVLASGVVKTEVRQRAQRGPHGRNKKRRGTRQSERLLARLQPTANRQVPPGDC
jgi:hypothetical protein